MQYKTLGKINIRLDKHQEEKILGKINVREDKHQAIQKNNILGSDE